jgi:predicted 3-demethylubiquinone-9 3-methyltransferase (glyoxalase superfamily)
MAKLGNACGKIVLHLWYSGEAEGAARFYASILDQAFLAISARPLDTFNHSVSFVVYCDDQAEVDRYWNALLEGGGQPEPCGWLRDKYGLSWQIVPAVLPELLGDPDRNRARRVGEAMLKMVKLDIAGLKAAAAG